MEAKNWYLILIIIEAFVGGILLSEWVKRYDTEIISIQNKEIIRKDSIINDYKLRLDDCMFTREEFDRIVKIIEDVN